MNHSCGREKQVRAIVIDDDELMRRVVKVALETLGCEIVGEAGDGEAGLELFAQTAPDLVLLDIRMPEIDGFEVLQAIKDRNENAYVVMMTFLGDETSVEDSMIGGAKDFLRKDMAMKSIVARLERHVARLSQPN